MGKTGQEGSNDNAAIGLFGLTTQALKGHARTGRRLKKTKGKTRTGWTSPKTIRNDRPGGATLERREQAARQSASHSSAEGSCARGELEPRARLGGLNYAAAQTIKGCTVPAWSGGTDLCNVVFLRTLCVCSGVDGCLPKQGTRTTSRCLVKWVVKYGYEIGRELFS
ncbi:hypothetical protein LX36DRAFT_72380 [Colletotrichum falcatum]|nr:hypothetical protein LX36DRAFT_72380 [Colletotrichum falcatum]